MNKFKQYLWQPGKYTVKKILELLVRIKLKRTKPTIIGITGSFGKTSTKEAVYEVMRNTWRVYRNPKSLNSEFGLLLAILEQPSAFDSPIKWFFVLLRALANAFFGKKYDFMILEYGADRPGDIKHLTSLVKPDIAIITRISRVHQAHGQFKSEHEVFEEKKKLVECLSNNGIAILNKEDKYLRNLEGKLAAKTFWFGNGGIISAQNLKNTKTGFSAEIHMAGKKYPANFAIPGTYHCALFLPALLCGTLNGIKLKEGILALEHFQLPPGRMSIITGKNDSIILDGSYNASPETVISALNLLKDFPCEHGGRRIAVLGNMNELGEFTEEAHKRVAQEIGSWLDLLITVGEYASLIAAEILKKGNTKPKIKSLLTADEAAYFILENGIQKNDVILFKGSQNLVRLERVIEKIMAHPKDAKKLLCRQEKEWKKIQ